MAEHYTVYALYYANKPMEVATAEGFIGSTRQAPNKCMQDHNKWIAKGTHTNKNLNATKGRPLSMYVIASGLTLEQCNNLLRTLRPDAGMGWNMTRACRSTTERHLGKLRSDKTKKLMSQSMTGKNLGKKYSEAHKANISKGSQSRFKPVNIYDYATETVIAEGVCLPRWCLANGYTKSGLYKTVNATFFEPHHTTKNCYFYRDIYARYVSEVVAETARGIVPSVV